MNRWMVWLSAAIMLAGAGIWTAGANEGMVLAEGWKHLTAAEKAAEGQEAIVNRVRVAQLPALYALLRDWKTHRARVEELKAEWPFGPEPQAVYDRFIQVAKANQITVICEWQGGFGLMDQALEAAKK